MGKYIFFDFENGWQQLVRDDFELDLSQIENELVVQPASTATAPVGALDLASSGPGTASSAQVGYTGAPAAAATLSASSTGSGAP